MDFLADLWMPIVVAAVLVFIASSVIHMVLPIHAGDYGKMPNEDGVLAAMRDAGVKRGTYMLPGCTSMKSMGEPGMIEKFEQGPVGFLTVLDNGLPAIGRNLVRWVLLSLLIGVMTAYVGHHGLAPGADAGTVFRITGTVAIAGYALGAVQDWIWKGVPFHIAAKFILDGLVYGLVTAATFAWMWPAAV